MSGNRMWMGAMCGVVAGLAAAAVVGGGRADAADTFKVTPEQLQINQRISQAAVRRSNEALNLLGPVRPAGSTDQNPINPFSASQRGKGWPTIAYADSSVTTAKIADGAITAAKLAAGSVGTTALADAAVTAAKIANGAVGTTQLADAAVTTAKIATGAVSTTLLADAAVTTAKIANGAVGTTQLADAAVTTAKIANNAVGNAQLTADVQANLPMTAAVDVGGNLLRGRGAVQSFGPSGGLYTVQFNRSIAQCTWTATISVDNGFPTQQVFIDTALNTGNNTQLFVRMKDDAGANAANGFNVHVVC